MRRLVVLTILSVLAVLAACKTAGEDCSVDKDCANGSFCNDDGKCEAVDNSDGGGTAPDGATGCLTPTATCATDTDCCSGRCSRGRCASSAGTSSASSSSSGSTSSTSSTSSGGSCKGLYEPCVDGSECCSGGCSMGACR